MSEHVLHGSVFLVCLLIYLAGCTKAPSEVQAPIDASGETEDAELREFVSGMYARANEDLHSPLHRGRLGMVYDANGFTEAAVVTYRQAGVLDAKDMRWPYLESLALSEQGRIEEAVDVMGTAIQRDSSYLPAYLAKGYWMIDLGEFERACDTFESVSTASNMDDHTIALQLGLAQCRLELGEIEKAIIALDTLPSNGLPAYAELVRARVKRISDGSTSEENTRADFGDLGQISWPDAIAGAVVEYTRGLSNEALLTQKLIDGGRAEDALQLVRSLQQRYPDEAHLIELRSAALVALGRRAEALTVLRDGLQRYPDEHLLHFNLGLLHDSMGQIAAALDHYDGAIAKQIDFVPAYDAKVRLLMRQGSAILARDVLNASLAHRPPNAETYNLLGVLYGGGGDWERSAEHLANAVKLEPGNVDALVSLALSLSELEQYEEALKAIERARQLEPSNPKVERGLRTLIANGVFSAETLKITNHQGEFTSQ